MNYSFSGINIYSKRPMESLAFYKKLGLRSLHEPPPDDPWYGATLALQEEQDKPCIWIWRASEDGGDGACNHLVFSGGNLQTVWEQLRAAGIDCEPPFRAVWGGFELILHDPDGNEILFL